PNPRSTPFPYTTLFRSDYISNIDIRGDNVSETHTFVVRINESKRNNFLYAGEELKVDLYYNRIARADVNPSLSISHDAGYETFQDRKSTRLNSSHVSIS